MIRIVLDTNIVISGSLWSGTPKEVMALLDTNKILALASEGMLDELKEVLERTKFSKRLELLGKSAQEIVSHYASKVEIIEATSLEEAVASDPDDDIFLACALSGKAELIVSGDPHLLDVGSYQDILIVTAGEFLQKFLKNDEAN